MKVKSFIIELILLTAMVVLLAYYINIVIKAYYNIDLHGTYFVFLGPIAALPISCLLIFITYLIKESFYGYKRRRQNIILLASVFLFNVCLLFGFNLARRFTSEATFTTGNGGWTIYPPLSALPQTHVNPRISQALPFEHFFTVFIYTQIFFLLLLVIVAIITGKNWNSLKNVS